MSATLDQLISSFGQFAEEVGKTIERSFDELLKEQEVPSDNLSGDKEQEQQEPGQGGPGQKESEQPESEQQPEQPEPDKDEYNFIKTIFKMMKEGGQVSEHIDEDDEDEFIQMCLGRPCQKGKRLAEKILTSVNDVCEKEDLLGKTERLGKQLVKDMYDLGPKLLASINESLSEKQELEPEQDPVNKDKQD